VATFGHVTQGALESIPLLGDKKYSLFAVAPESGQLNSLAVDMQNDGSAIQAFRAGVYTLAGTLTHVSGDVLIAPGMTRQWVTFALGAGPDIVAGSTYLLTLHAGLTGGQASFWYDNSLGHEYVAADIFADGLESTYGAIESDLVQSPAIYAGYTPSSLSPRGLSAVRSYAGWK
jgi:hypothetical protein